MTANTLFPGRPNYEGPAEGIFGLLHHEVLWEPSHNVHERVEYVKAEKPPNEVAIRLHNMIYLGGCPTAIAASALEAEHWLELDALNEDRLAKLDAPNKDYWAKRDALKDDYWDWAKLKPLNDDYRTKMRLLNGDYGAKVQALNEDYWAKMKLLNAEIEAYIKSHIPDCAWDGKTLVFPIMQPL